MNYLLVLNFFILLILNIYYGSTRKRHRIKIGIKNSKKCTYGLDLGDLLALFLLGYLIFLACVHTNIPDYNTYYSDYYNISVFKRTLEPGYDFLSTIARNAGLSFQGFRITIYLFCGISVWRFLAVQRVNKSIVLSLYALFPFVYDAIQIRNFLALSILLWFIPSLLSGSKKGRIMFAFGVFVSFSIHYLCVVYFVLLLVPTNKESIDSKRKKLLIFVFVVSFLVVFLFRFIPSIRRIITSYLASNLDSVRARHYFSEGSNFGFLIFIMLETLYIYTAKLNKDNLLFQKNESEIGLAQSTFYIDLAVGCMFPLLVANSNFYRIFRNMLLINYSIPAIGDSGKGKLGQWVIFLFAIAFLLNLGWTYYTDGLDVFFVFFT